MSRLNVDTKFLLQTRPDFNGNPAYWIAKAHHNDWDIVEEFTWKAGASENLLIEWLERLIAENKIDVADAIRVAIYYGQG